MGLAFLKCEGEGPSRTDLFCSRQVSDSGPGYEVLAV